MLLTTTKHLIAHYAPLSFVRKLTAKRLRGLKESIRRLEVEGYQELRVEDVELRAIRLGDGPELVGHLPTRMECRLCGDEAAAKGLDESYTKVLIDAITRYHYPHIAVPLQSIPYPIKQRAYFHPQHNSLVSEDQNLSLNIRAEITRIFMPKIGWHVLDIGAYLGHGALWLQRHIGSTGMILCVEANMSNYSVLLEQIRRNDIKNVIVRNAAIWSRSGEAVMFNNTERQRNAVDSDVVSGKQVSCVRTTSIGELTSELGRAADLASLTVNGAEVEAVEGLLDCPNDNLPKRIMAPGWYRKKGVFRSDIVASYLERLNYRVVTTSGHFVLAWRQDLV